MMQTLRQENYTRPFKGGILHNTLKVCALLQNKDKTRLAKHQAVQAAWGNLQKLLPRSWRQGEQEGMERFFEILLQDEQRNQVQEQFRISTKCNTTCSKGHENPFIKKDTMHYIRLPTNYISIPILTSDPEKMNLLTLLKSYLRSGEYKSDIICKTCGDKGGHLSLVVTLPPTLFITNINKL